MIKAPQTTIWENTSSGKKLVKSRAGIPNTTPRQGELIQDREFGKTICSGAKCSGSNEEVIEIQLTIQ